MNNMNPFFPGQDFLNILPGSNQFQAWNAQAVPNNQTAPMQGMPIFPFMQNPWMSQQKGSPQAGTNVPNGFAPVNPWQQSIPNANLQNEAPQNEVSPVSEQDETVKQTDITLDEFPNVKMSEKDFDRIVSLYGTNIEDIFYLNAGEETFLMTEESLSGLELLHFVLYIKGTIDTSIFKKALDYLVETMSPLRAAYVYRGMARPYKVILKHRAAEVSYYQVELPEATEEAAKEYIERVLQKNNLRGFDLENDRLLRVQVHSDGKGNNVVIISQPHINTDGTSIGILLGNLKKIFAGEELKQLSYKEYAQYLETETDKESELEYWRNLLKGYQKPSAFNYEKAYIGASKNMVLDKDTTIKLMRMQGSTRATLFIILQSIMAINYLKYIGKKDVVFGTVISGRDLQEASSMKITGGFANVLPIRVMVDDDMTFAEIAGNLQKQFGRSQANSHCSENEICKVCGLQYPMIALVTNYLFFTMPSLEELNSASSPDDPLQIGEGQVVINSTENLNIVFTKINGEMHMSINYNVLSFDVRTIEYIQEYAKSVIAYILEHGPEVKFSEIPGPSKEEFESCVKEANMLQEKYEQVVLTHPVLKEIPADRISNLLNASQVVNYSRWDTVFNENEDLSGVPFVLNGSVIIYTRNKAGQELPVMINKTGDVCGFQGSNGKAVFRAEALEDDTVVIYLDSRQMQGLVEDYPKLLLGQCSVLYNTMLQYIGLWANT